MYGKTRIFLFSVSFSSFILKDFTIIQLYIIYCYRTLIHVISSPLSCLRHRHVLAIMSSPSFPCIISSPSFPCIISSPSCPCIISSPSCPCIISSPSCPYVIFSPSCPRHHVLLTDSHLTPPLSARTFDDYTKHSNHQGYPTDLKYHRPLRRSAVFKNSSFK